MANPPPHSTATAARAVPLAEVLSTLDPQYGTLSETQQVPCPVHEDRHPSARFYADTNSLFCFTCQKTFDPISLVQAKLGLSFTDAIAWLDQAFDVLPIPEGLGTFVRAQVRRVATPNPDAMLALLEHALRAARPAVSLETFVRRSTAIDLLHYQLTQGMITSELFRQHATTLLGKLHHDTTAQLASQ